MRLLFCLLLVSHTSFLPGDAPRARDQKNAAERRSWTIVTLGDSIT